MRLVSNTGTFYEGRQRYKHSMDPESVAQTQIRALYSDSFISPAVRFGVDFLRR